MTDADKSTLWDRNYKALLQGNAVSKFGSIGFTIAITLVLKELTDSGLIMAMVLGMSAVSAILFGSFAGVVADESEFKQKVMVKADMLAFVTALALALLFYLSDNTVVKVGGLMVAVFVLAACQSFYGISAKTLVPSIVDKAHLLRANANMTSSVSAANILGQGFAGVFLLVLGPVVFFIVDALTYLYSSICARVIKTTPDDDELAAKKAATKTPFSLTKIFTAIKSSWQASKEFPGLTGVFMLVAIVNFISAPTAMYLAFLTQDQLGLSADWYAWFMVFLTLGGISGALIAKKLKDSNRYHVIMVALLILSTAKLLVAASTHYAMAISLLFIEANLYTVLSVMIVTTIQQQTPKEIMGKVFGIVEVFGRIAMPLGLMVGGLLVDISDKNMPMVFAINGVALFIACAFFARLKPLRDYFQGKTPEATTLVAE